jgi:hypothetical protein
MPKVTKAKREARSQRQAALTAQKIAGIIPGKVTQGEVAGLRAAKRRAKARAAKNKRK